MLLRVLPDTFGYAFPFAMVIAGTALASRRLAAPMVAAVAAFGVPLAIFTNLHLHSQLLSVFERHLRAGGRRHRN